MKLVLENDFHGTAVEVRPRLVAGRLEISLRATRRARARLCGAQNCLCSGETGQRPEVFDLWIRG